jgi:hypothetical protein
MTRTTLRPMLTRVYLPELADDDLSEAVRWVRHCYDSGLRFSAWLIDALLDEQTRRIQSHDGVPRETAVLLLSTTEWTGRDLKQALTVLTALSYCVGSEAVGRMVDKLVWLFTAVIGARLTALENRNAQNAT